MIACRFLNVHSSTLLGLVVLACASSSMDPEAMSAASDFQPVQHVRKMRSASDNEPCDQHRMWALEAEVQELQRQLRICTKQNCSDSASGLYRASFVGCLLLPFLIGLGYMVGTWKTSCPNWLSAMLYSSADEHCDSLSPKGEVFAPKSALEFAAVAQCSDLKCRIDRRYTPQQSMDEDHAHESKVSGISSHTSSMSHPAMPREAEKSFKEQNGKAGAGKRDTGEVFARLKEVNQTPPRTAEQGLLQRTSEGFSVSHAADQSSQKHLSSRNGVKNSTSPLLRPDHSPLLRPQWSSPAAPSTPAASSVHNGSPSRKNCLVVDDICIVGIPASPPPGLPPGLPPPPLVGLPVSPLQHRMGGSPPPPGLPPPPWMEEVQLPPASPEGVDVAPSSDIEDTEDNTDSSAVVKTDDVKAGVHDNASLPSKMEEAGEDVEAEVHDEVEQDETGPEEVEADMENDVEQSAQEMEEQAQVQVNSKLVPNKGHGTKKSSRNESCKGQSKKLSASKKSSTALKISDICSNSSNSEAKPQVAEVNLVENVVPCSKDVVRKLRSHSEESTAVSNADVGPRGPSWYSDAAEAAAAAAAWCVVNMAASGRCVGARLFKNGEVYDEEPATTQKPNHARPARKDKESQRVQNKKTSAATPLKRRLPCGYEVFVLVALMLVVVLLGKVSAPVSEVGALKDTRFDIQEGATGLGLSKQDGSDWADTNNLCSKRPPLRHLHLAYEPAEPSNHVPRIVLRAPCITKSFYAVAKKFRPSATWYFVRTKVPEDGRFMKVEVEIKHADEAPMFVQSATTEGLMPFLSENILPLFGELNCRTYEWYLASKKGLIWTLFDGMDNEQNSSETITRQRPMMLELAEKFQNKYQVVWINTHTHKEWLEAWLTVGPYPAIVVQRQAGSLQRFTGRFQEADEMTLSEVEEFVEEVDQRKIEPDRIDVWHEAEMDGSSMVVEASMLDVQTVPAEERRVNCSATVPRSPDEESCMPAKLDNCRL